MINISESQLAEKLVNGVHDSSSTEELILFVAGQEEMLTFCQELLDQFDHGESSHLVQLTDTFCATLGMLPGALYEEVRKVLLALNRFIDTERNHYEILYLDTDATIEEVKKAYRTLSKQYHPDSTSPGNGGAEKFLEISGAYHSIMSAASHHDSNRNIKWRQQPSNRRERKSLARKKFLATVLALVFVLAIASFFIAERYNSNVIIRQLHSNTVSSYPVPENTETDGKLPPQSVPPDSTVHPLANEMADSDVGLQNANAGPKNPEQITVEAILANIQTSQPDPDETLGPLVNHTNTPLQEVEQKQQEQRSEDISSPTIENQSSVYDPVSALEAAINVDQNPTLPAPQDTLADTAPIGKDEKTQGVTTENKDRTDQKAIDVEPKEHVSKSDVKAEVISQAIHQPLAFPDTHDELQRKEQRIQKINTTLEISSLLKEYTKLYKQKDLEPFLALFSDNATENDHELAAEIDQYKSLFEHTREIELNIENVTWTNEKEGYRARGNFYSSYTYHDGNTRKFTGDISFELINELGTLKIQSLNYVFQ